MYYQLKNIVFNVMNYTLMFHLKCHTWSLWQPNTWDVKYIWRKAFKHTCIHCYRLAWLHLDHPLFPRDKPTAPSKIHTWPDRIMSYWVYWQWFQTGCHHDWLIYLPVTLDRFKDHADSCKHTFEPVCRYTLLFVNIKLICTCGSSIKRSSHLCESVSLGNNDN